MLDKITSRSNSIKGTRRLLACGVVAGILSPLVVSIQAFTRQGFDLTIHPLSMLSLGDLGWIQVSNFIVTGLLLIACAVGIRRLLHPGPGGTWGPLLIGVYGVILIAAGVFTVDPMLGFPPGTPEGMPSTLSWHAQLHNFTFLGAFLALIVEYFVFARRFTATRQWVWAAYCAITGITIPALIILAIANPPVFGTLLFATGIIASIWIAAVSARLLTEQNPTRSTN